MVLGGVTGGSAWRWPGVELWCTAAFRRRASEARGEAADKLVWVGAEWGWASGHQLKAPRCTHCRAGGREARRGEVWRREHPAAARPHARCIAAHHGGGTAAATARLPRPLPRSLPPSLPPGPHQEAVSHGIIGAGELAADLRVVQVGAHKHVLAGGLVHVSAAGGWGVGGAAGAAGCLRSRWRPPAWPAASGNMRREQAPGLSGRPLARGACSVRRRAQHQPT